jgi:chromosome segregation protein
VARELDALAVPQPRHDRAAEARGELAAVRAGAERGRAEMARLEARLVALEAQAAEFDDQATRRRAEVDGVTVEERDAVAGAEAAESARTDAVARLEAARAEARDTASAEKVWSARTEALAMALAESAGSAGAGRLAGEAGVLGPLAGLVEVDPGWEDAWTAAAAELAHTVVVDGVDAARQVLAGLDDAGILALGAPAATPTPALPAGCPGEPLRAHVRSSHPGVDRALDVLLAGAVVVPGDWAEALDASLSHPEVVALTRAGDRFGATAWRRGNTGTAATRMALDDARRRWEEAVAAAAGATARLADVSAEAEHAIAAAKEAAHRRDVAVRASRTARADLDRAQTRRRETLAEAEGVRSHVEQLARRLAHEEARLAELAELLPVLEAEDTAGAAEAARLNAARAEVQDRMSALRSRRTGLDMAATALRDRQAYLARRLGEVEDRLARSTAEREAAGARRQQIELLSIRTGRLAALVDDRLAVLEAELVDVRARRERQAQALATASGRLEDLRRRRQDAERRLEEVRERFRRAELDEAEARMRQEAAVESLRRELDCEPDTAIAAACPDLKDGTSPASRVRELERELRLMGPVNPLALEELAALQERHAFVAAQLEDVKGTRRELTKVIRAVEIEMAQLLAAAYADVADHFVRLFETLFPGGQGRLRLTDPDNLLDAGIEVEARPAGKNVRKLSLLSGGERSLVALAFLFAVFRSRPSPFYLLDEVEAALDDVNLTRFLDLLGEFRQEAQVLIVTHQKRTMEAADCLYGVTMQPGGSSRVVSERVTATA